MGSPRVLLLYPHQLFRPEFLPRADLVLLVEDPLFFGTDASYPVSMHRHKLILHRSSMRHYRATLQQAGIEVELVELSAMSTSSDAVGRSVSRGARRLLVLDPCDDVLQRRLSSACQEWGVPLEVLDSPGFLLTRADVAEQFPAESHPRMASFYRRQRTRWDILLTPEGGPVGGKWSYDADNRKKLPRNHAVPDPWQPDETAEVARARNWVASEFPGNPGSDASFHWPVTHRDARRWLDDFLENRLDEFGPYEDALDSESMLVFHSGISVPLNLGLLTPGEVVQATLRRHEARPAPLSSLEGFLRQIVGWREYMRGVYVTRGVRLRTANRLELSRQLGPQWWEGDTGLPPLDDVIAKVHQFGYAHHIERLMVLGNLMLLVGADPDEVYKWFMGMFIDAYDWVMVPNVYGMSQFSDLTGIVTKPYVSGSNYIRKMSHYRCDGTVDGSQEGRNWCEVWDGLFWRFVDRRSDLFRSNPRTSVLVSNLDRMDPDRRSRLMRAAEGFISEVTAEPGEPGSSAASRDV